MDFQLATVREDLHKFLCTSCAYLT